METEGWVGAEYTPAGAPGNSLWWHWYDEYEASVERELAFAARRLRVTAVRMFLHSMVFEANSSALMSSMDRFLSTAALHNISVGFVFFDDCWASSGASLDAQCVPVKGRHNGCWMTSPQTADRTSVARYEPYVTSIVARFARDPRVLWWEVFNEPNLQLSFSASLRDAAFAWAVAQAPQAPVISCWDDNADTQIVDHHDYSTAFSSWATALYQNPAKGSVITEGGSRWYQPPFSADAGSPLTVINFLDALRAERSAGTRAWVPGAMISWELMVGNSNTRWHWNSADQTPEPAIPWDAWLFPDGTPVSHTEAAALRRYVTGVDEFLSFSKFLPSPPSVTNGDSYLTISPGTAWTAPLANGVASVTDALVEASVWLEAAGEVHLVVRAAASAVAWPARDTQTAAAAHSANTAKRQAPKHRDHRGTAPILGDAGCKLGPYMNNTDVCSGGPVGYRDFSVQGATDPLATCAAACCAWGECTAWIVRQLAGADANCTDTLCCWLKPGCNQTSPFPGATSGRVAQPPAPPGPPVPPSIDGYHVVVNGSTGMLSLVRAAGGALKQLGSFNLSTLDNGLVLGAWNMVRVLVTTPPGGGGADIAVFFNPMFGETGFVGNASDALRTPHPLPPRIAVHDPVALPPGGLLLAAGGAAALVDYVSALPSSVF